MGALLPAAVTVTDAEAAAAEPFEWTTPDLTFSFDFSAGKLRQKSLLPAAYPKTAPRPPASSGVETAVHCSGEGSPDPGIKQGAGQPGSRLVFAPTLARFDPKSDKARWNFKRP
jgi:hypothetical protein